MLIETHQFEKVALWHQFSIEDEKAELDFEATVWSGRTVDDMIDVTPGMVHIGTVRAMTVNVGVEIHNSEPTESFEDWDHVTEAAIEIPSGKFVIFACDYFPDLPRIEVSSGVYRVRVYYGKLDSLSEDGLDGDDHYKVALWPGEYIDPIVIKRWRTAKRRLPNS